VLVAIIAAVGYRVSVFREPTPAPTPRIAFITGGSGPYWQATVNGAKAAAKKFHVDLQVQMLEHNESLEEQMSILSKLDLASLDGVALSPLDAEGQTHRINQMVRELNVVTFDSDAELSDRHSHVGTSNFSAGRACARLVNEALPEGGKIAVLMANMTKENLIDRKGGFQERISQLANDTEGDAAAPRMTIVGYFVDNGNDEKCAQNIRDILGEHADLACFVGLNARHGPVLLRTLKELGKLGQIKLVTFDASDETLDGIEAGYIFATIAQDPYLFGYDAVKTLDTLCRAEAVEIPIVGKGSVFVGAEAIRAENLEKFRNRLRTRQGTAESGKDSGEKKPAA
jgi:ribose transport system substrate-binding protein